MPRRSFFVCLLSLTTLWVSSASAQSPARSAARAAVQRLGPPAIRVARHDTDSSAWRGRVSPILANTLRRLDSLPSGPIIYISCARSALGHGALFIVDGIAIGLKGDSTIDDSLALRMLSPLDPDDIASVEVVKGARAVELYGPGAHNGAVVITTKGKRRRR